MKIFITAASIMIAMAVTTPGMAQVAPVAGEKGAAAAAPVLTIGFTGIATPAGMVLVSVFDSQAAFDAGKPVRTAAAMVKGAAAEAAFEGLSAGRYAVKAFHDIDGDGQMAVNPFGMPSEPFAFSNDAVGNMGPATWDQAAFDVGPGSVRHAIVIR